MSNAVYILQLTYFEKDTFVPCVYKSEFANKSYIVLGKNIIVLGILIIVIRYELSISDRSARSLNSPVH